MAATPHKAPTIRPLASHHENYPSLIDQTCRTLLEKPGTAHMWCTPMDPPHMAEQKQEVQLEHTYSSSVKIRDVALKTCQKRWTIGRSGEWRSGISVLAARHDDDDDDDDRFKLHYVLRLSLCMLYIYQSILGSWLLSIDLSVGSYGVAANVLDYKASSISSSTIRD